MQNEHADPRQDGLESNRAFDLPTDLTIAVIHFQTPEVLSECLRRVREAAPGVRLLVVDTGEAEPLPSDWQEANAELLRIANHSYANAVNAAAHACNTPLLAFMNADAYVEAETFANLAYALRDPDVAAAGPLVRDADGRLQDQGLPYRWHQARVQFGKPAVDVQWLSACLQMVRVEAVTGGAGSSENQRPADSHRSLSPSDALRPVGGMDATLRFYNEDLEWGWRMNSAGWRCRLVATPTVHLGGNATPPQHDAFMVEGLRGGYVLSQRYRPWWFRVMHRYAVMLWAALQERFGDPQNRRAYRAIRRMFAEKRFAESPFGATLADENPAFWNEMT